MFHEIPEEILKRMRQLEEIDSADRADETHRMQRLRQIPPETGRFLAILAGSAPEGKYIEIGTSAGYSGLWIALACRETNRKLTTFEVLEEKAALARETFRHAAVEDVVELIVGDARGHLPTIENVAFCFLDAEKEIYLDCYDAVVPNLVPGGILLADNAISHAETLAPMLDRALNDDRVDAIIVPIGTGELLCRRLKAKWHLI